MKEKIKKILKKKGRKKIICLTSYSKSITEIINKYCDLILVGDSLGMVLYGFKTTRSVNLETMILHAKAVKEASKKKLVVFDMPYKTYTNKKTAYKNAKKVIQLTKCDAVKLEGGKKISNIVKYLVKKGIPVLGHVGLLPQYSKNFKIKGKSPNQRKKILEDALILSKSGVFAIVVECVIESLAKKITNSVSVPTIGIGASKYCDGQILVTDDMIGLSNFYPKFVKRYSNIRKIIQKSVKDYANDVINGKFPSSKNAYNF
tara:strand:- start:154 stop:933 length:780 start_codon:yes stop_codon:yes gene_type:complete